LIRFVTQRLHIGYPSVWNQKDNRTIGSAFEKGNAALLKRALIKPGRPAACTPVVSMSTTAFEQQNMRFSNDDKSNLGVKSPTDSTEKLDT
jgi:hypothetical protein